MLEDLAGVAERAPDEPTGPPNGMRHAFRVDTPMRLRITTSMAIAMKPTLPTIVSRPIRRSRRIATQMPSGTMTSDTSSFTISGQHDEHGVEPPLALEHAVDREADEHPEERVGVEVLHVRARHRRVQQVGERAQERHPARLEAVLGVEEHGNRAGADRRGLGEQQRADGRERPSRRARGR